MFFTRVERLRAARVAVPGRAHRAQRVVGRGVDAVPAVPELAADGRARGPPARRAPPLHAQATYVHTHTRTHALVPMRPKAYTSTKSDRRMAPSIPG